MKPDIHGRLHPSLKAYIECFLSAPFPKGWPRGGSIWDQDPTLVRDFRFIMKFERDWKNAQDQMSDASSQMGSFGSGGRPPSGGNIDLSGMLDNYLEELGDDGAF